MISLKRLICPLYNPQMSTMIMIYEVIQDHNSIMK